MAISPPIDPEDLAGVRKDLSSKGGNPRDAKRRLAREIVAVYHGSDAARSAEEAFDRLFIQKELPEEMPEFHLEKPEVFLVQVLKSAGLVASNGEGRRLIAQGAVQVNGEIIEDINYVVRQGTSYTVKAGKRRFLKIS